MDRATEEAEYQIQASELKHGLKPGIPIGNHDKEKVNRLRSAGMMTKRRLHAKCVVRITPSGTVMNLRVEALRKNGLLPRGCDFVAGVIMIIWAMSVQEAGFAMLKGAEIITTDYYMTSRREAFLIIVSRKSFFIQTENTKKQDKAH